MSDATTFVDLALSGEILDPATQVDDFIERWHHVETHLPLHEWLGFQSDEFALFVERPKFLRAILMARKNGLPLDQALAIADDGAARLAARGVPPEEIPEIRKWLERTGKL